MDTAYYVRAHTRAQRYDLLACTSGLKTAFKRRAYLLRHFRSKELHTHSLHYGVLPSRRMISRMQGPVRGAVGKST